MLKKFDDHAAQAAATYVSEITDFAALTAETHARFIPTARDPDVKENLCRLNENVLSMVHGGVARERALFLIGESGSGKSFSLRHHFRTEAAFQPYEDKHGRVVTPLLSIELRASTSRKSLAAHIIRKINPDLPLRLNRNEDELYELLETQLREHRVVYLHIDEAQHLIKGKEASILAVQNLIKTMVDMDWPLNVVLSGVTDLSVLLLNDNQLQNRSIVMRFHRLSFPANSDHVSGWVRTIVQEECGLSMEKEVRSKTFPHRLVVASDGAFGTTIRLTRNACLLAVRHGHKEVGIRHFARVYEDQYACLPRDNPFTAKNFQTIDVRMATADMVPDEPKRRGRKSR